MSKVKKVEYWSCPKKTHKHRDEQSALLCASKANRPKRWEILAQKNKALKEQVYELKQAVANARIDILKDMISKKTMAFKNEDFLSDIFGKDSLKQDEVAQYSQRIDAALETLTYREILVIRFCYSGQTYAKIGRLLDLTGTRIAQIRSKALRKLRHPYRTKILRGMSEKQI